MPPLPQSRSWWADHERAVQLLCAFTLLWGVAYLTWRIGWSGRGAAPVPFLVLLAAELYGFLSLTLYAWTGWRVPESVRPKLEGRPTVDVFVCTYDEPLTVLEPTLLGCRAISYPHTTYVLDDGRRPQVAALAAELGAQYLTRPDNAHAKAGNVNHALGCTDGELVLVLDADHVPHPEILDATLGYFDDPKMALVQTPHDFSNRDSMQHTTSARHEQSLFYEVLAPGKDRVGAMFWCGSAAVIRRDALFSVGGVLTQTIAEDFHTTIAMHARGWRSRYHAETLVQGLAPHDLGAFLLQRERWARGNLRVFRTRENPLVCRGLTMRQRMSYLTSLLNYFSGLQRALLLGVLIFTLLSGRLPMSASVIALLVLWLPWALLAFATSRTLARGRLGASDSTVYGLETMSIYLRAIMTLVWPRTGMFKVTPKEGVDSGGWQVLRRLGFVSVIGAVLLASVALRALDALGVVALPPLPTLALAITLGAGVWELAFFARTLVPLVRRRQHRTQYRFDVAVQGRIKNSIVSVGDLSPSGLAFSSPVAWPVGDRTELLTRLPDPDGVLHDLELPLTVRSARYSEDEHAWRIGCEMVGLAPETRRLLIQYCYVVQQADRSHPGRPIRLLEAAEASQAAS
ncbi:MAG: glycosyltransferase [Acidimicrobiia bacterium]